MMKNTYNQMNFNSYHPELILTSLALKLKRVYPPPSTAAEMESKGLFFVSSRKK